MFTDRQKIIMQEALGALREAVETQFFLEGTKDPDKSKRLGILLGEISLLLREIESRKILLPFNLILTSGIVVGFFLHWCVDLIIQIIH